MKELQQGAWLEI